MKRRAFMAVMLSSAAATTLLWTPVAWAGSYLDRAALLLDEAQKEGDLLKARSTDKEIVALIAALAETRLDAGRHMEVPVAIAKAHPHFLLVLEHSERAADAASKGDLKKLLTHLTSARDEEAIFRAVVAELGYTLTPPKSRN